MMLAHLTQWKSGCSRTPRSLGYPPLDVLKVSVRRAAFLGVARAHLQQGAFLTIKSLAHGRDSGRSFTLGDRDTGNSSA